MLHPFRHQRDSALHGLALGVAASRGDKYGVMPTGYRTHAQQRFFAWRRDVRNDGTHARIEPQAYLYRGPFGFMASWVASRQALAAAPVGSARDVTMTAWFAAVHWVLTGENASYRGVTPARPFQRGGGNWGAWEIAARTDHFAAGDEAFPAFADANTSARRARNVTLGVNWFMSAAAKFSLNLEHTSFAGGENNVVTRADERAVLARLQLRY